jgi:cadherin EGF LAG seven-pass G-type receptor 1
MFGDFLNRSFPLSSFCLLNECVPLLLFLFTVKDGGNPSRSNTTQLLVNVKDVNDNAPRFYSSTFQESVVENVPIGHSIVRVQAYDADDGSNAQITYRIQELNSGGESLSLPFGIDPDTGWIVTVRDLDREENHHHQFEVRTKSLSVITKSRTYRVI